MTTISRFGDPKGAMQTNTNGEIVDIISAAGKHSNMSRFALDVNNNPIGLIDLNGNQISGASIPSPFTSRVLIGTDNGETLICATAQAATVNSGMVSGFGCAFDGTVTFTAGAGVTITDSRVTGSLVAFCSLVQIGTNAYRVIGSAL